MPCENLRSKAYNATAEVKARTAARNASDESKASRRDNVAAFRATAHGRLATQVANTANRDRRRATDPLFAVSDRLRTLVAGAIKRAGYTKDSKTYELLGASFTIVMEHLLSPLGLADCDIPDGYVIDHIVPMALSFDEASARRLNHYTNLQLLTEADNLEKSDKLPSGNKASLLTSEEKKIQFKLYFP